MSLGFTADMDNEAVPQDMLQPFMVAMARPLDWRVPDAGEKGAFALRGELRRSGDSLFAVCDGFASGAWVLKNDWSGFPDPAEYVFLGFDAEGQVYAKGYFDDWPDGWTQQTT
jgi:hypothetical protein